MACCVFHLFIFFTSWLPGLSLLVYGVALRMWLADKEGQLVVGSTSFQEDGWPQRQYEAIGE